MEKKKVTVSTVSIRKFVENLLYLGSVGGEVTDKCVAFKGMFLRAEVMVDVDTPIKETQEMKVAPGLPIKQEEKKEEEMETPKAKKTARKTAAKKQEPVVEEVEDKEEE